MRVVFSICVFFAMVSFAVAEAVVLPKTSQLVPAETIVLVDIGDFNQLRAKFEKSFIYKFCKDPAMAAFIDSFTGKLREKLAGPDNSIIGLKSVLDTNGLPQGKVAIAFVMRENAEAEQEASILLICQWGVNVDRIKENIDSMVAKAIEKGAHRTIEEYRDVNLVTLTTPAPVPPAASETRGEAPLSPANAEQTARGKTAYCFIDDCLIAAADVDMVKFVVAHIKGATGSALAGDPDYVSVMGAVGPYHDVDIYVNLRQLLRKMAASDKTGDDQRILSNLGFDGVGGLGCSLGFGTDGGGSLGAKVFLKTLGSRKGVLKMLETSLGPIRPPRFVPASAYSVSFFNVDVRRAYDELVGIIYSFDPVEAVKFQKPLVEPGENGEPGVSLRPDIIEYLGSEIVISQNINKPFSAGVAPAETLIAVALSNRSALEKSLSVVHKRLIAPNNPEPSRELLGHTIYLLGPIGLPFLGSAVPVQADGPRATPSASRMAFTITDTHLILGEEPAVERAIRTLAGAESEPISSAKWFVRAQSAVPSVVGLAGFEDNSASGELLWWMLKESARTRRSNIGMGPAAAVLSSSGLWSFADFSLLPEFEAVKKYFGYSAFYGVSRADGFLFEFKYLEPR
jgi:hypothetical protein